MRILKISLFALLSFAACTALASSEPKKKEPSKKEEGKKESVGGLGSSIEKSLGDATKETNNPKKDKGRGN